MPSNVIHYYFADEVLKQLSGDIARIIDENRDAYDLGAQGPDVLFYLKFKGEPKLLGEHIHKAADVFPLFEQSSQYLTKNYSDTLAAFVFGQLCHYASDRVIHPYVYFMEKKLLAYYPENAHKHIHVLIESAFDYLCIRDYMHLNTVFYKGADKVKIKPNSRKIVARYFSDLVAPLFNDVLSEKTAEKAIKRMRLFLQLCNDPLKIKYCLIRLVECLMGVSKTISLFIRPRREKKEEDWFNYNRTPFPKYHNQEVMTDETFDELFLRAKSDATALIKNIYDRINNNTPLDKKLYKLNYSG